jgi:hypothetical protein
MKTIRLLTAAGWLVIATGCVPSLNPLYTAKDLVFDSALVGVWSEGDDAKETWAFEKAEDKAYNLTYTQDGKKGEFKAHLLKLDDKLFLDLYPESDAMGDWNRNDFFKSLWVPAHTFARVTGIEPELKMAFLNPDWLKELVEKDPKVIAHQKLGEDRYIFTASTKDLQQFILRHVNDAFGETSDLKRRKK